MEITAKGGAQSPTGRLLVFPVLCVRVMKGMGGSSKKGWNSGCNLKVQLTRFLGGM